MCEAGERSHESLQCQPGQACNLHPASMALRAVCKSPALMDLDLQALQPIKPCHAPSIGPSCSLIDQTMDPHNELEQEAQRVQAA